MTTVPPIVIVGASARAAAQSALRADLQPYAVDCFADSDLVQLCPVQRVDHYPEDLVAATRKHPVAPWIYTGALENYPDIIRSISRERPLLGNPPEVVRAVRDPWNLAAALAEKGLPFPELRRAHEIPGRGIWMCKPYRSGGGLRMRRVTADVKPPSPCPPTHYWQRWQTGQAVSAACIGDRRRATLLGVTFQLVGLAWTGASEFQYCGSVGPIQLSRAERQLIEQIATVLCHTFGLVGLFGIDLVREPQQLWPLEVNPRYTASIEVLERAGGLTSLALHCAACRQQPVPADIRAWDHGACGKAILYAARTTVVTPAFVNWAFRQTLPDHAPAVADIPSAGSCVQASQPICTLLATGHDSADVEHQLRTSAAVTRTVLDTAS